MNKALLLRLRSKGLKIDPHYIQYLNNPYIDNIENDYLDREFRENIDERNETAARVIESEDIRMVKKCLFKETRQRIGEQGIQELAQDYRCIRNKELKDREDDFKKNFATVKKQTYNYLITSHPQAVEGLSYYEVLTHINHFMRTHPKWVSKEIQCLRTF